MRGCRGGEGVAAADVVLASVLVTVTVAAAGRRVLRTKMRTRGSAG
jgi:hypothetical protein